MKNENENSVTVRSRPRTAERTPAICSVLVVDDQEPIRGFLRRRLEAWGYTVTEADSASQALSLMVVEPASIAVVDLGLGGPNGLWLAERIRQRWPNTAIIIATGTDDTSAIQKSRTLGAIDYVFKPFDSHRLRQAFVRASEVTGCPN